MSAPMLQGMQSINTNKSSTGAPAVGAEVTTVAAPIIDFAQNDWSGLQHIFSGSAPNSAPLEIVPTQPGPNGGIIPNNFPGVTSSPSVPNNVGTFINTLRAKLGLDRKSVV